MTGGQRAFLVGRQRLAAELRRLREEAKLSTRQLAEKMGCSQAKVVNLETGRRAVKPKDAKLWGQSTGLTEDQVELLVEHAEKAIDEMATWRQSMRGWPDGLAGIQREVAVLEQTANTIRIYQPLLVPGLLQTAEYARRVFLESEPARLDVADAVSVRMDRQSILYEPDRKFEFIIAEASLRWRIGPANVYLSQFDRLRQVSTLSNVKIGIIPVDIEAAVWHYHGFVLFDDCANSDPVAVIGLLGSNFTVSDAADVELYRHTFDQLWAWAAVGDNMSAILHRLESNLKNKT
ncbi:MAG: helix-turn-helix domain-containing protein [Candidatus Dormibacteraceae bacterium]